MCCCCCLCRHLPQLLGGRAPASYKRTIFVPGAAYTFADRLGLPKPAHGVSLVLLPHAAIEQVGPITTEAKVYQWVMLTYRRFGQAFLADVYADRGEIAGHPDRRDDEETLADGNPGETTSSAPLLVSLVDNATVTSSFITCMLERLRETSAEFEWLEDVVDRYREFDVLRVSESFGWARQYG